jgi:hypothetical protein
VFSKTLIAVHQTTLRHIPNRKLDIPHREIVCLIKETNTATETAWLGRTNTAGTLQNICQKVCFASHEITSALLHVKTIHPMLQGIPVL